MKYISLLGLLLVQLTALSLFGQAPPIHWQRTIGGSADDRLTTLIQTNDGGYIAAGMSKSGISGDKTEASRGDHDFWIVKLSNLGNIQWQKTYGSQHTDQPFSIVQTSDNGFLVSGYSMGDISGDKTEPNRGITGTFNQGYDCWILKLDATGNIQWQRTYGTNGNEVVYSALQRNSSVLVVAGLSEWHTSLPAPRTPDRTTANPTWNDFWLLKLDAGTGAIMHQEAHGGNRHDNLFYIIPTTDGGYMGGGLSGSGAGTGNKTTPLYGGYDNWLIKMDSNFNAQWQVELGGAQDDWGVGGNAIDENSGEGGMEQTTDGGFIVANTTLSGATGNKTEASFGGWDCWLVKLNSTGGISWQKELGGSADDRAATVMQTPDGGYLVASTSNSPLSGNKTEASRGGNDYWLIKLDAAQNIEWQKVLGGSDDDQITIARRTTDGGYILGGFSKSNISGEKSENSRGDYDFWIIKLGKCDTTIYKDDSLCIGASYRLPGGRVVSAPGVYTDSLKTAMGCDSVLVTTLTHKQDLIHLMNGQLLGDDTVLCAGDSRILNATYPGATSYQWSTGATSPSIQVTQTNSYRVTVTSAKGCTASDTVTISFISAPDVDLGPDISICLSDTPIVLQSPQPAGARYLWSNGLGYPEMTVTRNGAHWLEVSIGNCKGSDTVYVKLIPDPEVYIGADTVICEQRPLRIGTEVPGATYLWSTGATTTHINVNATGSYSLEVDLEGCKRSDTVLITAMPAPEVDLGPDRDICPDETLILDVSLPGNNIYEWNTGASTSSYAATTPGAYRVQVTTEYGCTGTDSVTLVNHPLPLVMVGPDTVVCEETPLLLRPLFMSNAESFRWSDGSTGETLWITQGGEYILTGVNRCGTGSDTIQVQSIFCDIWVPNAFTPNGDGVNDLFRVLGNSGRLEGFELSVFNRWGQRIFHTDNTKMGWDGRFNGGDAPVGTYVYQMRYSIGGRAYLHKGSFHLVR
jgi:gliding motility-associated-like protein